jgi:hypothetical protein
MKTTTLTVAAAAMVMFAQSAYAREHHHRHHHHNHVAASRGAFRHAGSGPAVPDGLFSFAAANVSVDRTAYRSRDRARPAAWCGWEMRRLVGSDPGPSYNLARNWSHWGRSGPAGVGAIVVWPHHVGKIVGRQNGEWIIESGNDGHALRTRPRSIGGAIAIRWG